MEYKYNWHILEPHSLDFLVYDRLDNFNRISLGQVPNSIANQTRQNVFQQPNSMLHTLV